MTRDPLRHGALLAASHLTRRFGDRTAVEDVSLEIASGETLVLLGPNGAGKTTTLRLLAGLLAPDSGSVLLEGRRLDPRTAGAARSRIGFLTEAPGLWERLSVARNLEVYARLHGVARPDAAVERALQDVQLWDRRTDLAGVLSKGMKQKLALARALLHRPVVVLLDEPTAGLDPEFARYVRERIQELRRKGCALLVSTHNLDEAERLADRIAVLQRRLLVVESPQMLRQRLYGRRVRVGFVVSPGTPEGEAHPLGRFISLAVAMGARDIERTGDELSMALDHPEEQVPELVRSLVQAGASIRSVMDEQQPLEEIYLRLVQET